MPFLCVPEDNPYLASTLTPIVHLGLLCVPPSAAHDKGLFVPDEIPKVSQRASIAYCVRFKPHKTSNPP